MGDNKKWFSEIEKKKVKSDDGNPEKRERKEDVNKKTENNIKNGDDKIYEYGIMKRKEKMKRRKKENMKKKNAEIVKRE